jgi:hypothetical protein
MFDSSVPAINGASWGLKPSQAKRSAKSLIFDGRRHVAVQVHRNHGAAHQIAQSQWR